MIFLTEDAFQKQFHIMFDGEKNFGVLSYFSTARYSEVFVFRNAQLGSNEYDGKSDSPTSDSSQPACVVIHNCYKNLFAMHRCHWSALFGWIKLVFAWGSLYQVNRTYLACAFSLMRMDAVATMMSAWWWRLHWVVTIRYERLHAYLTYSTCLETVHLRCYVCTDHLRICASQTVRPLRHSRYYDSPKIDSYLQPT